MKTIQKQAVKKIVWDIIVDVSWANISKKYFGKSRSWLHHKLQGTDSNNGFTDDERQQLKESLYDLANRTNACADKL